MPQPFPLPNSNEIILIPKEIFPIPMELSQLVQIPSFLSPELPSSWPGYPSGTFLTRIPELFGLGGFYIPSHSSSFHAEQGSGLSWDLPGMGFPFSFSPLFQHLPNPASSQPGLGIPG